MSQVDQKRAFNKLKHDLEPMRNVIVRMDSVLTWERNYYPAIICSSITLFYLILWWLDMSIVTMLSLCGLIGLLFDFLYPSITRLLCNTDDWTGKQEELFEVVVEQLFTLKVQLTAWYEYLFTNKEPKSTMFVIIMGSALLIMAWIGAIINNYFLMYVLTMGLALYPGMQDKGVLKQFKTKICCLLNINSQKKPQEIPKKDE